MKCGRPRIDTSITENGAPSRRQAVNAMYMFEGVHLITVAATEIPDSNLLWFSDDKTHTARGKNGKTSKEIEKAIRKIRISSKDKDKCPENERAINDARVAVYALYDMGDAFVQNS